MMTSKAAMKGYLIIALGGKCRHLERDEFLATVHNRRQFELIPRNVSQLIRRDKGCC